MKEISLTNENTEQQKEKLPYIAPFLIMLDPKEIHGGGSDMQEANGGGLLGS